MRQEPGFNRNSSTTAAVARVSTEDAIGDDSRGMVHVGAAAEPAGIVLEDAAGGSRRTVDLKSRATTVGPGGAAAVGAEIAVLQPPTFGRHGAVEVAVTRDDVAVRDDATRHVNRPADVQPAILAVFAFVERHVPNGRPGVEHVHSPGVVPAVENGLALIGADNRHRLRNVEPGDVGTIAVRACVLVSPGGDVNGPGHIVVGVGGVDGALEVVRGFLPRVVRELVGAGHGDVCVHGMDVDVERRAFAAASQHHCVGAWTRNCDCRDCKRYGRQTTSKENTRQFHLTGILS